MAVETKNQGDVGGQSGLTNQGSGASSRGKTGEFGKAGEFGKSSDTGKSEFKSAEYSSGGYDGEHDMHKEELRHQAANIGRDFTTMKRDVRELAGTAGDVMMDQLDPVVDYVHRQPVKALLIAAAVGAVIGCTFWRR